jgi:hypothetical protein
MLSIGLRQFRALAKRRCVSVEPPRVERKDYCCRL